MGGFNPITFIDTWAFAASVYSKRNLFQENERTKLAGSPHHATKSIILRAPAERKLETWIDDVDHFDSAELTGWKIATNLLTKIRRQIGNAEMGKAMVVLLKPGGVIDWHRDEGPYYEKHWRFHLPIVTNPLCLMYSGSSAAHMPVGQLTGFDNIDWHSAANHGQHDRIHLIVDIRKPEKG